MLKYNSQGDLVFSSNQKPLKALVENNNYKQPIYVYDSQGLTQRAQFLQQTLQKIEIFYALKANAFAPLVRKYVDLGLGLDVVSIGEIEWGLRQGCPPEKMIFSGVGKSIHEINMALRWGIRQINVESLPELERIAQVSKDLGIKAPVALRVNPDVDAETHPYIATGLKNNKFGIETEALPQAQQILLRHRDHLHFMGFSLHIGSQILELNPLSEALIKLRKVIEDWKKQGWKFSHLDAGGGLGIFYHFFDAPKEEALAQEWQKIINQEWGALGAQLLVEPGRWLVGHYGVLLCQIEYIKKTSHHQFVIVDTGMHHLMRPALYQAEHRVLPLQKNTSRAEQVYQIVGPICESSDVIRHEVVLPEVHQGEFLAILDAGAYGSTMSSLYNQRSPALEVWWE